MDGYDLFLISGIDGNFQEFHATLGLELIGLRLYELCYDRAKTFKHNIVYMKSIIESNHCNCTLLGWSIGGAAALYLADCRNVTSIIAINSFYTRSEVLKKRGIICDEEVLISETNRQQKKYTIICGALDDKVPPIESKRIIEHLALSENNLQTFTGASHNISSFPLKELASSIKRNL